MKNKSYKRFAALIAAVVLSVAACGTSDMVSVTSSSVTETTAAEETTAETTAVTEKEELDMEKLKDKKLMALTFDDGPNTTITPQILDILEEYGIKASFYVIGQNINEDSGAVMKRAHDMGCEINSHSFTHSYMNEMTADEIKEEMDKTAELVYSYCGEYPKFFRPPYIAVNSVMYDTIDVPFICGMSCNDCNEKVTVEKRIQFVTQKCDDGCIVLLHDAQGNQKTVDALKEIIPAMLEDGWAFLTTAEIFEAKGVMPSVDTEIMYSYASVSGSN